MVKIEISRWKEKNLSTFTLDPEEKTLEEISERKILSFLGMLAKLNKEKKELVNILGHLQLFSDNFSNA